jgi:uncharacterized protein (TIGR02452 family)
VRTSALIWLAMIKTWKMSKNKLQKIAEDTVSILKAGRLPNGETIETQLEHCVKYTYIMGSDNFDPLILTLLDNQLLNSVNETIVEITSETTLEAAARLAAGGENIFVLNFASAKNPGGGFLRGARAQEESLARSSGLYASLSSDIAEEYYLENRKCGTPLYTDLMIYSPQVPFFRDDTGSFLEKPYLATVLTIPAPNADVIRQNAPSDIPKISSVLESRIDQILSMAVLNGHRKLVLGAWGCGIFGNSPEQVATLFKAALDGTFRNAFSEVVFAVLDKKEKFLKIFGTATKEGTDK